MESSIRDLYYLFLKYHGSAEQIGNIIETQFTYYNYMHLIKFFIDYEKGTIIYHGNASAMLLSGD